MNGMPNNGGMNQNPQSGGMGQPNMDPRMMNMPGYPARSFMPGSWGNSQNMPPPDFFQQSPPVQASGSPQSQSLQPATDGFTGRYVDDPSEIKANEVPMDGRLSIFPTNDLNAVFLKAWNSNGRMLTIKYVPDPTWQEPPVTQASTQQDDILRRLEALEQSFAASNVPQTKSKAKNKKEDDE